MVPLVTKTRRWVSMPEPVELVADVVVEAALVPDVELEALEADWLPCEVDVPPPPAPPVPAPESPQAKARGPSVTMKRALARPSELDIAAG